MKVGGSNGFGTGYYGFPACGNTATLGFCPAFPSRPARHSVPRRASGFVPRPPVCPPARAGRFGKKLGQTRRVWPSLEKNSFARAAFAGVWNKTSTHVTRLTEFGTKLPWTRHVCPSFAENFLGRRAFAGVLNKTVLNAARLPEFFLQRSCQRPVYQGFAPADPFRP
jgi:hypothetical protein